MVLLRERKFLTASKGNLSNTMTLRQVFRVFDTELTLATRKELSEYTNQMLLATQHFLISTYTYLEITINNLHPTDQYIIQQIHEKRTDVSKKSLNNNNIYMDSLLM